jgi:tetratricopeptide (TPR) repeat protein
MGAGTFEFWWYEHATTDESLRDTHNMWLENMAELGLPGLLLIVAVALSAIWVAVSVRSRVRRGFSAGAAAAALAAFLVYLLHASVDWMWEATAVTVLALAGIGAVAGRLSERRLRLSVAPRAALAFAAAAAALLQLPGIFSTTDIRRSQAAETARHGNLALAWANAAVSAEPWSASAYAQRGLVLESAGRLKEAAADLNRATSHEPDDYAHWLVLARINTERGDVGTAVRDYQRAHQLRPRSASFVLAPYFRQPGAVRRPAVPRAPAAP